MSGALHQLSKLACLSVLVWVVMSCEGGGFVDPGGEEAAQEPTSLALASLLEPITEDDTVAVRGILLDQEGAPILDAALTWSTSDDRIAHIQDEQGAAATLVAKQPGTTTITVSYETLSASAEIKVHNRPVDIVAISGSGQEALGGETLRDSLVLRAVDRRGDGVSGVRIGFTVTAGGGSVSPSSGLTDVNGFLRSAWNLGSPGPQTAEARASEDQDRVKNLKDSVVVFTAQAIATLHSLEVHPSSATLEEGDTLRLNADATASDGSHVSDPQVLWESTDTTVVAIRSSGLVWALRVGTARVIARPASSGSTLSDTADFSIIAPAATVTGLDIRPASATVDTLGMQQFDAIALMSDGTEKLATVEWAATGGSIRDDGLYTAGATAGAYTVIASHSLGYADTAAVTVVAPDPSVARVMVSPAIDTLEVGETSQLTATLLDQDGNVLADRAVAWSSSDRTVATVDGDGLVTAAGPGQAVVTATSEGVSGSATAVVAEAETTEPVVATVSVAPSSHAFTSVGQTAQITATGYDSVGNVVETAIFQFTSSEPATVSVDSMGLMTARAIGAASILVAAICCDATATVEVEVTPPSTTTRFVSTTGSDAAAGTESSPWGTIGYALTQLEPGQTLYVRGGEYEENIKDPDIRAGRPDARIRVAAYPGERPVLRGLLWLDRPNYWTIDGLNVTWSTANEATDHMVKMTNGVGWVYENAELWGARSFAGLLVYGSIAGEPADWTIRGNCIHDVWTDPIHHVNGDHNLYINTGASAGAGLIERNILFNAPNGQNVKLGYGSSDPQPGHGAANVTVRYNTMYSALKNLMVTDESHHITIERNIIQSSEEGYALRAYLLTGSDNVIRDNVLYEMSYLQYGDPGYRLVSDGGGNLLPHDPAFDSIACSAFRPTDDTAKAFGRYAP